MGHPDKLADQISDGVLDALIAIDPYSRVACETMVTTGLAMIAGEITSKAKVNYPESSATLSVKLVIPPVKWALQRIRVPFLTSIDAQKS